MLQIISNPFVLDSLPVISLHQTVAHRTLLYGHAVLLRHSYSGMVSAHTRIHTKSAKIPPILE